MQSTSSILFAIVLVALLLLSHSGRPIYIPHVTFVVPRTHRARPQNIGTNRVHTVSSVSTAPCDTNAPEVADAAAATQFKIIASKTDEPSLRQAARFMVDAYWLSSPSSLIIGADGSISGQSNNTAAAVLTMDEARNQLAEDQLDDFVGRYDGRRMDRLLHSRLLTAIGSVAGSVKPEMLGIVGMEVRLCDKESQVIHSTQQSEEIILESIVNGEKDDMIHLPHCVPMLVDERLPPEFSAVCVLSNLAVSPKARRQGLANKLCKEVERLAESYCGCDQVYLEVEESNVAARRLYEDKLGYAPHCKGDAPAKRVDLATGRFVDVKMPTLVMVKNVTAK